MTRRILSGLLILTLLMTAGVTPALTEAGISCEIPLWRDISEFAPRKEDATMIQPAALRPYQPDQDTLAILEAELRSGFDFFWETANGNPDSPGFGLIPDRMPSNPKMCSIAAVGYGLAALCIGAERGYVAREEAEARALGTLNTLLNNAEQMHGFFFHFLNMNTAKRFGECEVSIIDTAICLCGVLAAGAYFGGECQALADEIYRRVEWPWYTDGQTGQFYMGYNPGRGFGGAWDMTAEQFMMYFLGAASPTHPVPGDMFYKFARPRARYGALPEIIHSPGGSLFVYQFSHMWFDLRHTVDRNGVDWFHNSALAVHASRQYAIDMAYAYGTGALDWGFSACDGPRGYRGSYGAQPAFDTGNDGTIATYAAAASLPFAPEAAAEAVRAQTTVPGLTGQWGLKDAYNLTQDPVWIASDTLGIDKGSSMVMIENYLTGFIWLLMDSIPYVREGMALCGVTEREDIAEVYNVALAGGRAVGDTLEVIYEAWPQQGDVIVTGVTWMRADSSRGENAAPIAEADGLKYVLTDEDLDKFIYCVLDSALVTSAGVTPLAQVQSNSTPRIVEAVQRTGAEERRVTKGTLGLRPRPSQGETSEYS